MQISRKEAQPGFLRVTVTPLESAQLEEVFKILSHPDRVKVYRPGATERFAELMHELFPSFPLKPVSGKPSEPTYTTYMHDKDGRVVHDPKAYAIGIQQFLPLSSSALSNLEIVRTTYQAELELQIDLSNYTPTSVDTLVEVLGKKETPPLRGAQAYQRVRNGKEPETAYSVTNLLYLDRILKLYEKAKDLIPKAPDLLQLRKDDLAILCRDGQKHPNLFIRQGSEKLHRELLEQLARHT